MVGVARAAEHPAYALTAPVRRAHAGLVALLASASLVFVSWTGWGFETDPAAQLLRDSPWLVLAGLTGAGAGAGVVWSLFGRRGPAMAIGVALGVLPAAVMVTAYFADTY